MLASGKRKYVILRQEIEIAARIWQEVERDMMYRTGQI